VENVIEGAYEVLGIFDRVEEKRDAMQSLILPTPARQAIANAALRYRFGEEHQPVTVSQLLTPCRHEDTDDDLCTECYYLTHYPGSLSLCSRLVEGKHWPCAISMDGDTLYCERFIDCQE
jgi:hypothetical protein